MRPLLDYDFLVWIAEDEYTRLDEQRRDALIDHQLCHIAVNDNGGWSLECHDVEEFNIIIKRYGAWQPDLVRTQAAFEEVAQLKFQEFKAPSHQEGVIATLKPGDIEKVLDVQGEIEVA